MCREKTALARYDVISLHFLSFVSDEFYAEIILNYFEDILLS
jgi:hypothetical protein